MMKNMTKEIFEHKYKIVTNLDVDKVKEEINRENFERMFILVLNDSFQERWQAHLVGEHLKIICKYTYLCLLFVISLSLSSYILTCSCCNVMSS